MAARVQAVGLVGAEVDLATYGIEGRVFSLFDDKHPQRDIVVIKGQILDNKLNADAQAVVNAANSQLSHDGGVALAISQAAGPQLQADSTIHVRTAGEVETGTAWVGDAYQLEKRGFKKVIHAVGPRYSDKNHEQLLADTYQNSLALADEQGLTSISFPAISTAIFGYPFEEATQIAVAAIGDYFNQHPESKITKVNLFVWDGDAQADEKLEIYKKQFSYGKPTKKLSELVPAGQAHARRLSKKPSSTKPISTTQTPEKDTTDAKKKNGATGSNTGKLSKVTNSLGNNQKQAWYTKQWPWVVILGAVGGIVSAGCLALYEYKKKQKDGRFAEDSAAAA